MQIYEHHFGTGLPQGKLSRRLRKLNKRKLKKLIKASLNAVYEAPGISFDDDKPAVIGKF